MTERDIVLAARALTEPAARAAYLDQTCAGDGALRGRVEAFLWESDPTRAFSARSPETAAFSADDFATSAYTPRDPDATALEAAAPANLARHAPGNQGLGTVIAGRFTLLDVIGEGGMGLVYLAEQTEPVRRQVALKLIKAGMDSRAVLARFDAERQALALMDHPNIARVYDGGTTPSGQPFFVMELVRGVPITTFCDQRRLSLKARLELMVLVCQAVQHAHQKGIIHRDLKPGNVLVTEVDGRPTPKIIDFGVAKATEQKLTELSFADVGAIVGTPVYMSPEQADPTSMDIDTRTDIFALGVILYELLAGSPPLDPAQFKRGALLEMLRMVREVEPPQPSARVSTALDLAKIAARRGADPAQLKRALQGDLDWVVMKALEKDRTRRYETANGLAADIVRHLSSEPVLAAPPSRAYRIRKFVRRHRGAVSAASLVVVVLLAGIAGTTGGLFEAQRQAKLAKDETLEKEKARQAEAVRAEGERVATQNALAAATAEHAAKERAEAAQEAGRRLLYTTDMRLAPFVWRDDRMTAEQLRVLLARHIPDNKAIAETNGGLVAKPDLRGFEWHYFQHLLNNSATVFSGHGVPVVDGAFTSNGQLVTLDENGQVRRRDQDSQDEDKEKRRDLPVESAGQALVLSPNGRLAAFSDGNQVRVFDTTTGNETFQLDSDNAGSCHLIFSRDNDRLVIVDNKIRWCSAVSGEVVATLNRKINSLNSLALSADGLTLAVVGHGAASRMASLFRLDAATKVVTPLAKDLLSDGGTVQASALSPNGQWLAVGQLYAGSFSVFDTGTGRRIAKHWSAHESPIVSMAFFDGARLATADSEGTINIWADAKSVNSNGKPLLTFKGHQGAIRAVRFANAGNRLLTTGVDKTARVWNLEGAGAAIQPLERHGWSRCVDIRFSPDGQIIAAATGVSNGVRLWDAATGRLARELSSGNQSRAQSVAFSAGDRRLLAVGYGGLGSYSYVSLWDMDAGTELARLPGATDLPGIRSPQESLAVDALAFSPDGKYLVAGLGGRGSFAPAGTPNALKVWEVATRRLVRRLDGHTGFCVSLDFSRDGKLLASGSRDGTAIIWSTTTWKPTQVLQNPDNSSQFGQSAPGMVEHVAFAPDGKSLALASFEGDVQLWDVASGKLLHRLKGHSSAVSAVVFSPDGRTLVSGSYDQTVRLWNVEQRQELMQMDFANVERGEVLTLAFSPDGRQLLAGNSNCAAFWSYAPIVWNDSAQAAERLRLLLQSSADFKNRIRMCSENLRLHEALTKLEQHDMRVKAALAAAQANWHASRQEWPEAGAAFDRLAAADPVAPEGWLRTPGLLRLATALFHQDRPDVAAMLLQGGGKRRIQDGLPAITPITGFGFKHQVEQGDIRLIRLEPNSPASASKLRVGDVVLKVNGTLLTEETIPNFEKMLEGGVGTKLRLTVRHQGSTGAEDVDLVKERFPLDLATGELIFPLLAVVEKRLANEPQNAGLHELRAELAGEENDFARQVAEYTAAIKILTAQTANALPGRLRRIYRRRGGAYLEMKEWGKAIGDFDLVVTPATNDSELLANRARAHDALKQWDAARSDWTRAGCQNWARPNWLAEQAAAHRTREGLPYLATLSAADPKDTTWPQLAPLQAWFGQDKEFEATRQRILACARGTNDARTAERAAKTCCIRPPTDKLEQESLLALGRAALKDRTAGSPYFEWHLLASGMAEFRGGSYLDADQALLAAVQARPNDSLIRGISAFYRAMSLNQLGKRDEACKLALTTAAAMKPLPRDENNPLAGGASENDLILWLAYKEAKALLKFDNGN